MKHIVIITAATIRGRLSELLQLLKKKEKKTTPEGNGEMFSQWQNTMCPKFGIEINQLYVKVVYWELSIFKLFYKTST